MRDKTIYDLQYHDADIQRDRNRKSAALAVRRRTVMVVVPRMTVTMAMMVAGMRIILFMIVVVMVVSRMIVGCMIVGCMVVGCMIVVVMIVGCMIVSCIARVLMRMIVGFGMLVARARPGFVVLILAHSRFRYSS